MPLSILDPSGIVRPPRRALRAVPASLQGIGVGLIDNSKPNAEFVLGWVGEALQQQYGVSLHWIHKRTEGGPAPEAQLAKLAAECQVTLAAIAE